MNNNSIAKDQNSLIKVLERFDDDELVDVFKIWDCGNQTWTEENVILFRFESNDLLLLENENAFRFRIMPVDTSYFDQSFMDSSLSDIDEPCLCWRIVAAFADLIGNNRVGPELAKRLSQSRQA